MSKRNSKALSLSISSVFVALFALDAGAATQNLPDPTTPAFCERVQQILASTEMTGEATLFDNMPDYRSSKPSPDPLMIYQVVTYDGQRPIAVSCKVKAADHIRATYGETEAGEQLACPAVTKMVQAQAAAELEAEYPDAAAVARALVIDNNEPYSTGQSYLGDFELSYTGEDGKTHISTPSLQTDWENWMFYLLPNRIRGQSYCHLATVPYIKALAMGEIKPGTLITAADDAAYYTQIVWRVVEPFSGATLAQSLSLRR